MTNPLKGQVAVTVDGVDLVLCYSAEAMCQLEARLGQDALTLCARITIDRSIRFTRSVLWAGLIECQADERDIPRYTERQAGEFLLGDNSVRVMEAIMTSWGHSWPILLPEVGDAADNPPKAPPARPRGAAGTGNGSTASMSATSSSARVRSSGTSPPASSKRRSMARSGG